MGLAQKVSQIQSTSGLARLLADGALSRAALGACGFPLALLDATSAERPVVYVNAAFEGFFGYAAREALGRPLAALLFRGDEPLVHHLLAEARSRWTLRAWRKDGELRHVELALGAVHDAHGELTHWVLAFSDRSEVEALRAELADLKTLAAAP